jgi:hypothetical protein
METKLNIELGRELETDELKNVSGGGSIGAGIQAGVNAVSGSIGAGIQVGVNAVSGSIGAGIQAGVNSVIK